MTKTEEVDSLPVCENRVGRKLVGIITDRDLARHVVGPAPTRIILLCRIKDGCDGGRDYETIQSASSLTNMSTCKGGVSPIQAG